MSLYLHGPQAKQAFKLLQAEKQSIEKDLGYEVDWQPLEGREACRIVVYKNGSIYNTVQRQELKEWLHLTAECFHKVFAPKVKALKLPQDSEEE